MPSVLQIVSEVVQHVCGHDRR